MRMRVRKIIVRSGMLLLLGISIFTVQDLAMAYDSAPPRRLDFQGGMQEPVAQEGQAYDSAPARRMDFQGRMAEPVAREGAAYDPAPPRRMDFLGSRRAEPAR